MTPTWTITADGADITAALKRYLLSVTVTDQAGMDADELEIAVADPRGELALPPLGARLEVTLGYRDGSLVKLGSFIADTLDLADPPRVLTIRAHGADITGELLTRKTKDWEATTVGGIVTAIGGEHHLTPAVGRDLSGKAIARLDQTNESDIAFLTRLGQLFDAIVTIKDGHVIFVSRTLGVSASGGALSAIALTPKQVTSWRFSTTTQAVPTTVDAPVWDKEEATGTVVRATVPKSAPGKLADLFAAKEAQYGLPDGLLTGVAKTESGFNPNAVSPAGAKGMFQFMPGTAAQYGVNVASPASSADGAARYLRDLHGQFGSWDKAIAAYNAGPGNIAKGIYPAETRAYVPRVKAAQQAATNGSGPAIRLRQTFTDPALAQAAAQSRAAAITRGATTLSLVLPGNPALAAETPITLTGFAAEVDGRWIITSCIHRLDDQGYSCTVEAEQPLAQAPTVKTITV